MLIRRSKLRCMFLVSCFLPNLTSMFTSVFRSLTVRSTRPVTGRHVAKTHYIRQYKMTSFITAKCLTLTMHELASYIAHPDMAFSHYMKAWEFEMDAFVGANPSAKCVSQLTGSTKPEWCVWCWFVLLWLALVFCIRSLNTCSSAAVPGVVPEEDSSIQNTELDSETSRAEFGEQSEGASKVGSDSAEVLEFQAQNRRLLPNYKNPIHVIDGPEQRYFIGIIDIFTVYGFKKRLEHLWKRLRHPRQSFSTVSPPAYCLRLCQWVQDHTK